MKFKLDENLSPSLAALFAAAAHEAHSVVQQALGGQPDDRVIDVCARKQRALVTLYLDFSNILAYPSRTAMQWIEAATCLSVHFNGAPGIAGPGGDNRDPQIHHSSRISEVPQDRVSAT